MQHCAGARCRDRAVRRARRGQWLAVANVGPLRERATRRRDFTIVNAPVITPRLRAQVGGAPFRMQLDGLLAEPLLAPGQGVPLASLAGKRIVAAAGIGNPGRFRPAARGRSGPGRTGAARPSRFSGPAFRPARRRHHPDHREGCSKMWAN
ncbi:tetraacyldisaccharide 4'-kinase [Massilia sp. B-10]|nr:tetraacyldisaccharide 4'-kinase [Massilia sp. B-10]